jgi:tetratricopeptide (TPR) repeat protein
MSSEGKPEELIEQGLAALGVAEFDDAIEMFGSAAVEAPHNPRAWFYLGLCYLETRQAALAVEALNRAISADSNYADAHYLLGSAVGAVGRLDEASSSYRRALEIDPHHHKAEEFLIRTEALLASREHYRKAVRLIYSDNREPDWLNRSVRELLHSVAIFNESPARDEFSRLAQEVLKTSSRIAVHGLPDEGGHFWATAVRSAQQAFDRRNWPEAATHYHEALDLSSEHPFIHHALGLIYFALGDVDGGIRAWQRAFDQDPEYDFSTAGQLID